MLREILLHGRLDDLNEEAGVLGELRGYSGQALGIPLSPSYSKILVQFHNSKGFDCPGDAYTSAEIIIQILLTKYCLQQALKVVQPLSH